MLNHYSIYWIKEEFAQFFYYRSEILCRFIKSYEHNQSREDLVKQFGYITLEFPQTSLIAHIMDYLPHNMSMQKKGDLLKIYDGNRYISLHMEEKRINFRSDIIHDAEEILFPALRSFHPYLFVVGNDTEDFGWISPVRQVTKRDKLGQALYSCL
ncbi:sporulation inhibitor of replication protein SirA [Lentibacillus cibarius]|uniref:Sporulation inhibitor of replication protein SirA n=1 Tax=Lentibacillus cibarius TaxID=2583219 RepID=A0A5S3QNZ8_9BACI|nr:sporulation inhibitor of replication protein SirA [Lentibacillus cibarius]TMN23654.1 sporulation inhibitor of replication protein SirA [Lentibacillus cibarius]